MNNPDPKIDLIANHEMLPEYDFSKGIQGKHYQAYQEGYTVKIYQEDGSTVVKNNIIEDDYAILLGSLATSLENTYNKMKESSLSLDNLDYSRIIVNRLRTFYCAQDEIKTFLDKRVAQAGADFFVETILFSLKLFNEIEGLGLDFSSERRVQRKRNAVRPDISIWRENTLLGVIECKTQLGWKRNNWESHFNEREKKIQETFPNVKIFWMVMTDCNWSGFGNDPRVGKQLFCLLKDTWPTGIPQSFDRSILQTPIELLLEQIKDSS